MPVPTQQDSTADETAGTAWPCPCVVSRSPSVGHMTVPPDKIVLLPLGMHRSGTSSLAGCLHLLGASLPKHLIPSKSDNPTGFFEPENIVMLNDEILASANSAWNDCGRFDPSLIPEGLVDKYVRRAVSMVSEEYDGARIIVLKDPRICRMLSFWFPVLGQAGYIPYVITPVRSPLEVAQSLHARNGLSLQAGMSLWLRHVIDAEFGSRSCHRFFFVWNQFLTDPNAILVELLQCFGFDLSALSPDRRQKITSFINADLRRFKAPTERLDGIPAECSVAFAALTALAKDPNCIAARQKLDELRAGLSEPETHWQHRDPPSLEGAARYGEHLPDRSLSASQAEVAPMRTADQVSTDADVHMMADGRRLPASRVGTNKWQFMVPANTLSLRLCSRAMRPEGIAGSADRRMLGLCVRAIDVDGSDGRQRLALDHPAFVVGLHPVERDGPRIWRWTNGNAVLPMSLLGRGPMLVTVVAESLPQYRLEDNCGSF